MVTVRGLCLMRGESQGELKVEAMKKSATDDNATVATLGYSSRSSSFRSELDASTVAIDVLQQEFPSITRSECQRFYEAHDSKEDDAPDKVLESVREQIQLFVEFRQMYGLDAEPPIGKGTDQDREDWNAAWEKVWKQVDKCGNCSQGLFPSTGKSKQKPGKMFPRKPIPQYTFTYPNPDHSNEILVQVFPALIDASGASPEQHAVAVNLYLEARLDRHASHKLTFCFDCRGSTGWTNANVFTLQPIITAVAHHNVQFQPGRIHQFVIFPVPRLAVGIFNVLKNALPAIVQERTVLVAGSERNCNLVKMAEKAHVPLKILQQMEKTREREAALGKKA